MTHLSGAVFGEANRHQFRTGPLDPLDVRRQLDPLAAAVRVPVAAVLNR